MRTPSVKVLTVLVPTASIPAASAEKLIEFVEIEGGAEVEVELEGELEVSGVSGGSGGSPPHRDGSQEQVLHTFGCR